MVFHGLYEIKLLRKPLESGDAPGRCGKERAGAKIGEVKDHFRYLCDFAILGGGIHWSLLWYGWQSDCRHRSSKEADALMSQKK